MKKHYLFLKRGILKLFLLVFLGTACQLNALEPINSNNNKKEILENKKDINTKSIEVQTPVTGMVTDSNGSPLPGANVLEKGTANGTQTDFDGKFSLTTTTANPVLVVSYLGFVSKEIRLNGQAEVNVVLQEDTAQLDEIVIVGYGSQKKSDLTGSISTLGADKIQERVSINPLDNLQGSVAGLNIYNSSGRPGGDMNVTIRGKGSLNATNDPLYVVDGIIGVDIQLVNTNDIESMTVLKDASATAIYGSRGANGVIIVTTKRGKSGKITVDFNANLKVASITHKPEMLNSTDFWKGLKVRLDADQLALGAGSGSFVADYPGTYPEFFSQDGTKYGTPRYNTNWLDETTRTSFSQQYFTNVRGGGENYNVSFSAGTQDDEGIIINTYLKKNTMRFNGDFQVNNWLKIGGSLAHSDTKTNIVDDYRIGADNITMRMLFYSPIYPTQYEDGTAVNADDLKNDSGGWDIWYGATPKDRLNIFERVTYRRQITRNIFTDITFNDHLKLKTSYSLIDYNQEFRSHEPKRLDTYTNRSAASLSNSNSKQSLLENTLSYNNTFNDNHTLGVILGTARQENESFGSSLRVQDFDDFYSFYNVGQGTATPTVSSDFSRYTTDSYFGRVNYSYMDKYLITATGRYDGSSRFGENNKYSFFPSAALAWKVSNESFLENSKSISDLKLRTSYGVTGNDGIGNYDRISRPGTQQVIFNRSRVIGSSQGALGNENLKWERTEEFNIGFDLGIFNRVDITADYYTRTTKDLLFNVPIAEFTGYSSILSNAGSIKNSGIELLINSTNVVTDNFKWRSSINFTKNDNEILSLGTEDKDIFTGPIWWNQQVFRVGETAGAFWGYNRLGTWGTDEVAEASRYGSIPGDIKLEDKNNDGLLNFDDQQIIGKGLPDYTMNIGNTFSYKNWDLSVDVRISKGNDILDHSIILFVDRVGYGNTYKKFYDQMWTPDNQNTMYPRVRKNITKFDGADSGQVFDGSFIRGQNLSLSYNFSNNFLDKIDLHAARIYFNLQNFFLITDYHGYDPEVSSFSGAFTEGIELNGYPKALTMNMGINFTF